MTIPIIPTARKTNPAPALFFLDSISLRVSSDNLMTGYFLLPIRYKISPDDPFVFAAKNPQSRGCFRPLDSASKPTIL